MFSSSTASIGLKSAKNQEMALCKNANVNFLIKLKMLSKYQESSFGEVK